MLDLINTSIAAHGGLARWLALRQISAEARFSGVAFAQRGQIAFTQAPVRISVNPAHQQVALAPFLAAG